MKRNFALLLVVMLLLATTVPALASWSWCSADPEVILPHGQGHINIWVDIPEGYEDHVVTLYLTLPEGSEIINHVGGVTINPVVTYAADDGPHKIYARVDEDLPAIRLGAVHDGKRLKTYLFKSGAGQAKWNY